MTSWITPDFQVPHILIALLTGTIIQRQPPVASITFIKKHPMRRFF